MAFVFGAGFLASLGMTVLEIVFQQPAKPRRSPAPAHREGGKDAVAFAIYSKGTLQAASFRGRRYFSAKRSVSAGLRGFSK
jgi:hypothetical protein